MTPIDEDSKRPFWQDSPDRDHCGDAARAGHIAPSELLAEQCVLRDAEDAHARILSATAVNLVALFKAFGSDWQTTSTMTSDSHPEGTGS